MGKAKLANMEKAPRPPGINTPLRRGDHDALVALRSEALAKLEMSVILNGGPGIGGLWRITDRQAMALVVWEAVHAVPQEARLAVAAGLDAGDLRDLLVQRGGDVPAREAWETLAGLPLQALCRLGAALLIRAEIAQALRLGMDVTPRASWFCGRPEPYPEEEA